MYNVHVIVLVFYSSYVCKSSKSPPYAQQKSVLADLEDKMPYSEFTFKPPPVTLIKHTCCVSYSPHTEALHILFKFMGINRDIKEDINGTREKKIENNDKKMKKKKY